MRSVNTNLTNIPFDDLDHVTQGVFKDVDELRGKRICILGGTGFVGKWLTSSLIWLDHNLDLKLKLDLFTRDSLKAYKMFDTKKNNIMFHQLDLSSSMNYELELPDIFIHGATASSISTGSHLRKNVFDASVNGISLLKNQILRIKGKKPVLVHLSSGAVYGTRSRYRPFAESDDITNSIGFDDYLDSKIFTEEMVRNGNELGLWHGCNARLFAFCGPHLPLSEHFAIGNFVKGALDDKCIRIKGNPETVRSYMYPSDLCVWIIKLITRPVLGAVNIGSEEFVTMKNLGELVKEKVKGSEIVYADKIESPSYYYPTTEKIRNSHGVKIEVSLDLAIEKWIKWLRSS